MSEPASPPVEVLPEFPNGPAIDGKSYVFDTEHGQRIIAMSEESWIQFGTTLESLRHVAKNQDVRIKELLAENAAQNRVLADTMSRLNALREIRKAEKRKDLESQINIPA